MQLSRSSLAAASLALAACFLLAPAEAIRVEEKAKVRFALDRTAYEPGSEAHLAAVLAIEPGWHVNSNPASYEYLIPTSLRVEPPAGWPAPAVSYPAGKKQKFTFADEPLSVYDGTVTLGARLAVPAGTAAGVQAIKATVTYQACNDNSCLPPVTKTEDVALTVGPGGEAANRDAFGTAGPGASAGGARPLGGKGLLAMLAFGLLGGLILNVMPCVLPVLSLKVFGLVRHAGDGRRAVATGALATAAGILASFWALGLVAVAARSAGEAVGWGIQFQNPAFVTFLALVILLFSLNLWGLFEIPLPQTFSRLGNSSAREGWAGHFASGLFATLMATPCSAPFLGTAVGFALAQSAPVILAVFTAVGLGMALPYLALAAFPGAARIFPKPGAWMDTVRGAMGFLLAGAAVWLLYVLGAQVSPVRLAVIELGLLFVALFVWLKHRSAERAPLARVAMAGLLASLLGTLWLAAAGERPAGSRTALAAESRIPWTAFNREEAEAQAAAGRLVFVDVTADWCFTCKVNEKLILNTDEVAAAFERHGVVPMKADWTNRNEEIGQYLASFERYGIPFYVLYRPEREPHVFSEVLSKDAVLRALDESAGMKLAAP